MREWFNKLFAGDLMPQHKAQAAADANAGKAGFAKKRKKAVNRVVAAVVSAAMLGTMGVAVAANAADGDAASTGTPTATVSSSSSASADPTATATTSGNTADQPAGDAGNTAGTAGATGTAGSAGTTGTDNSTAAGTEGATTEPTGTSNTGDPDSKDTATSSTNADTEDPASSDKQAASTPAPQVAAAPAAAARSIQSIDAITANANMPLPAEQWNAEPTEDSYITINSQTDGITDVTGVSFSDIVAAAKETKIQGHNPDQGKDYVYWKAVLLGKDGDTNYGPDGATQPWSGDTYYADDGLTLSKVRYVNLGRFSQLQFMPAEGDNAGNWVGINSDGSDLQLVLYYLQLNPLGQYVNLEYSQWGLDQYVNSEGGFIYQTPKAAMGQVVDAASGQVLANGAPMYWYGNHKGVRNVVVSEIDLGQYEIVKAKKYAATNQNNGTWQGTTDYSRENESDYLGVVLDEYTPDDMKGAGMSTVWTGRDDPNHVIFRVYVRKTAQVSLLKRLEGTDSNRYQNESFAFSAMVTLPESSDSTLRDSYPIEGTANSAENVHMVVSADGKSGTVTGIQAKPGQKVTLKGLPYGATVKFAETGVPTSDPSVFTTAYANSMTDATDGTAIARHYDDTGDIAPQTVTATNTVASGNGKLTVTKTFKGLNTLTDLQRENLRDAFQITSTDNKIPALTLANASSNNENAILTADSEATYTWTMEKLETGDVTLTEENYAVAGHGVTTESQVSNDGGKFQPSAETEITTDTKTVTFTNEYGTSSKDVTVKKVWDEGVANEQKNSVTVKLTWKGSETNPSDSTAYTGTIGEYTFDGTDNTDLETAPWEITVKDLPQHTGTYGDITYSIEETKVGEKTPAEAGFTATTSTDKDGTLVVTNSPATVALAANSIYVKKVVKGKDSANDQTFTFNLTCQSASVGAQCSDVQGLTNSKLTTTATGVTHSEAKTVSFSQKLTFPATKNATYTFHVKEDQTSVPAGWKYDDSTKTVTVSVNAGTNGYTATVTGTGEEIGTQDKPVVFTNTYIAVSSLPLTGASTGRQWLLVGGSIGGLALLMAGAAGLWRNGRRLV